MALIVEDGTGLSTAESYISVADADAYFSARGVTQWDGSTSHKEALLRIATEYMIGRYGQQWQGYRINGTQALDWPRSDVWAYGYPIDPDVVPDQVKRACAELAHRANSGDLLADQSRATRREKVDVIEVEYDPNAPRHTIYPQIDAMLAPLLESQGSATRKVFRT